MPASGGGGIAGANASSGAAACRGSLALLLHVHAMLRDFSFQLKVVIELDRSIDDREPFQS